MILANEQENKALLSNVDAGAAFKITASAKAFSILSSGLYSDKIRAIVRELSCNAYDSHVAAGRKDVPFEVHLPTALEPWFAVRDFGTGMSKEQVLDLYSTYFESTKTASNDFVGALGLGSKSPFSYTDNFSVTSTKDGKTGYFSAYINEQGFPAITCMAESPSAGAPAGVEVKFPVKSTDFAAFVTAAQRVLGTFAVAPKINKQFPFNKPNFMRKHVVPGASLLVGAQYSTALMGNIEYPIDINMLSKDDHKNLLRTVGVYLEFNIGELDFQASREHLSYIPMTVNAIEKRLDELMVGFEEDIKQKLNGVTNAWQLVKLINEFFTAKPYSVPLKRYLAANHPALANLISIDYGRIRADFKITPKDIETNAVCKIGGTDIVRLRRLSYRKANWHAMDWSTTWDRNTPSGMTNYMDVSLSSNPVIVVEDSTQVLSRVKTHYLNLPDNSMVYVIRRPAKDAVIDIEAVKKLFMYPPTVVLSSTLPVPPRVQKQRVTGKVKIAVLAIRDGAVDSTWSVADNAAYGEGGDDFSKFDTKKTFYYLPMKGFEVITTVKDGYTVKEAARAISNLHRIPMLGLNDATRLYGVRKDDLPAVQASKNWINLEDHIKSKLTALANDAKLQEQIAIRMFIDTYGLALQGGWKMCMADPDLKKKPLFARILEVYNECDGAHDPRNAFKQIERIAGTSMFDSLRTLAEKVREEIREKRKVYPLLDNVTSGVSAMPHIAQYVNLIDEYNAKQTQP